jgi:Sec-independent protein translocase protein TatA
MDTLCGVGLPELIIVALMGFVVIGPDRSRDLALKLGRMLSRVMRSPWFAEFQQITDALRNLPTTLVRMAELEEAQADIQRTISDIEHDTRIDVDLGSDKQGISDPWGIRNAAAESTFDPKPPDEENSDVPSVPETPDVEEDA